MRSIWKGHIRFLLVAIPIRVYNAIEASERIQFNQLHRDDFGPIVTTSAARNAVRSSPTIKSPKAISTNRTVTL
jgi:non-homologous end joining protein Ku